MLHRPSMGQFTVSSCVVDYISFSRDSVMEILFEQDNEEKSVASLILDALVKVQKSYSFYKGKMLCLWSVVYLLQSERKYINSRDSTKSFMVKTETNLLLQYLYTMILHGPLHHLLCLVWHHFASLIFRYGGSYSIPNYPAVNLQCLWREECSNPVFCSHVGVERTVWRSVVAKATLSCGHVM